MIFCYVAVTHPVLGLFAGRLPGIGAAPASTRRRSSTAARAFQVIWRIVFPIMLPGIVATATYSFLLMLVRVSVRARVFDQDVAQDHAARPLRLLRRAHGRMGPGHGRLGAHHLADLVPVPAAAEPARLGPSRRLGQAVTDARRAEPTRRRAPTRNRRWRGPRSQGRPSLKAQESAVHLLRRAHPRHHRLLRQRARQDAESRRARGAWHALSSAYCNCPICVPSRASLATGRYVHEIRCWDNAHPYDGSTRGWGHSLIRQGHEVTAIGKLHYRTVDDQTGFSEEINTLHVVDGIGDLLGMMRRELPLARQRQGSWPPTPAAANRPTPATTAASSRPTRGWLEAQGQAAHRTSRGCCSWASSCRISRWSRRPSSSTSIRSTRCRCRASTGPASGRTIRCSTRCAAAMNYADYFDERAIRTALAAYYGMVSFLDHNIGRLLQVLEDTGLAQDTRVIYTSDHGDNLGNRGFWGKSVMYEEAVAVPMIMAGDGIPRGQVVADAGLAGRSAPDLPRGPGRSSRSRRAALPGARCSSWRATSRPIGWFQRISRGRRHRRHLHGAQGTVEIHPLRRPPAAAVRSRGRPARGARSRRPAPSTPRCAPSSRRSCAGSVDPEAVNARAFADQERKIAEHGGPEAIKQRGDFGYTPAPGQTPVFG